MSFNKITARPCESSGQVGFHADTGRKVSKLKNEWRWAGRVRHVLRIATVLRVSALVTGARKEHFNAIISL